MSAKEKNAETNRDGSQSTEGKEKNDANFSTSAVWTFGADNSWLRKRGCGAESCPTHPLVLILLSTQLKAYSLSFPQPQQIRCLQTVPNGPWSSKSCPGEKCSLEKPQRDRLVAWHSGWGERSKGNSFFKYAHHFIMLLDRQKNYKDRFPTVNISADDGTFVTTNELILTHC